MGFRLVDLGFLLLASSPLTQSVIPEAQNAVVQSEIAIDGPALFYSIAQDRRREVWAVHCAQPLRGCTARAPGLSLRIDADGRPWLLAATNPEARISIQSRNLSRDTPLLFAEPLDDDTIQRLNRRGSFVVVEEAQKVALRTPTEGIAQVVSYLRWVSGATARTLGDARLWPKSGALDPAKMGRESREKYHILERRRAACEGPMVLPSTKPQIEFAIRAQDGASYYSGTGRAGY